MKEQTVLYIAICIAIVLCLIILFLFIYISTFHYMHHSYSSGSWINKNGDMVIIRNLGPLAKSQLKICENTGENYNVLESTARIITNPFTTPHKFTMHILDNPKLKAKVNMINGHLKLYSGDKFYGTYHRNGFQ
jgi:hypothetical protein